jgi:hypothetical protein
MSPHFSSPQSLNSSTGAGQTLRPLISLTRKRMIAMTSRT